VRRDGSWQATSWREYRDEVRRIARGFVALGLQPGQGVALFSGNRPEWLVAHLAAIGAGARPAGIYVTSADEQIRYIAQHCQAEIALAGNAEQLARLLALRGSLPHLRAIVLAEGESAEPGVHSWAEVARRAAAVPEERLRERIDALRPEDCASLVYTSGTTGPPKAVMLSHRNLVWMGAAIVRAAGMKADDRAVSYLPLSHVAEQMNSLYDPLTAGICVSFAESLETLADTLREVRPTIFFAVPRVWEKMEAAMEAAGTKAPLFRRKLVAWARRQGLAGGLAEQQGRGRPLAYGLARRLVFDTVRRRLGLDQARFCISSAAPISRRTLEFFLSLGIPILEVYGMSECAGPTTVSLPWRYRTGRVGLAIEGTELKVAGDGEVLMRGPHVFLGYLKDEGATAETIDAEGWLHSGDVGRLDEEGFLEITDRKKELLVTSGGKKTAPQLIEGLLKQLPGVAHAVAVGERRNYVAALLTLDRERLPAALLRAGSPAPDAAAAATCPVFRRFLEEHVETVNRSLARFESVRRFTVLPGEFSVEGGELTPTLKLKRRVIATRYAAEIEALYA
jgi:long-subunit acyl-CoA synthetase (AMP-forming)